MLDLVYNIEEIFRFCGSIIGTVVVNFKNAVVFMNDCIFNIAGLLAVLPSWIYHCFFTITSVTLLSKLIRLKG